LWFFGWGVSIGANTSTTTIGSTLFSFLFFSLSLARSCWTTRALHWYRAVVRQFDPFDFLYDFLVFGKNDDIIIIYNREEQ